MLLDVRQPQTQTQQAQPQPHPQTQGVGLGDIIARMTKAVGITPCTPCQKRQEALNKLRFGGW